MTPEPLVPKRTKAEDQALRAQLALFRTLGQRLTHLRNTLLDHDGNKLRGPRITAWCSEYTGNRRNFSRAWLSYLENDNRGKMPDEDGLRALAAMYRLTREDLLPTATLTPEQKRIQSALVELGEIAISTRKNPASSQGLSELDQASLADILEEVVRDVRRRGDQAGDEE